MTRYLKINPDTDDPLEYILELIKRREAGDTVLEIEPPTSFSSPGAYPGGTTYNPTTTIRYDNPGRNSRII